MNPSFSATPNNNGSWLPLTDICLVDDRGRPTGGLENQTSLGSPTVIGNAGANRGRSVCLPPIQRFRKREDTWPETLQSTSQPNNLSSVERKCPEWRRGLRLRDNVLGLERRTPLAVRCAPLLSFDTPRITGSDRVWTRRADGKRSTPVGW